SCGMTCSYLVVLFLAGKSWWPSIWPMMLNTWNGLSKRLGAAASPNWRMASSCERAPAPPLRGAWGWGIGFRSMFRLASSGNRFEQGLVWVPGQPEMHKKRGPSPLLTKREPTPLAATSRTDARAAVSNLHDHRQDDGPALGALVQEHLPHAVFHGGPLGQGLPVALAQGGQQPLPRLLQE